LKESIRVRPVHWQLAEGSQRRSLVHFLNIDDWLGYDDSLHVVCGANRASYDLLPDPEPEAPLCQHCLRRLQAFGRKGCSATLEDGRTPFLVTPAGIILKPGPYGSFLPFAPAFDDLSPRLRPSALAESI
jgi:hypothetical protein